MKPVGEQRNDLRMMWWEVQENCSAEPQKNCCHVRFSTVIIYFNINQCKIFNALHIQGNLF